MERVKPEEVVKAYANEGLFPYPMGWNLPGTRCDAWSALFLFVNRPYVERGGIITRELHGGTVDSEARVWAKQVYGSDYYVGFLAGWYSPQSVSPKVSLTEREREGESDGVECRRRVNDWFCTI